MKVALLGEALLRFSTTESKLLKETTNFDLNIGGTELNIAANISNLARENITDFYTVLPDNPLSEIVNKHCLKNMVNVINRPLSNSRMGIYFLEPKQGNKIGNVIFDRKKSAFSISKIDSFKIKSDQYDIFHTSGVALGTNPPNMNDVVTHFYKNIKTNFRSFDCNYRSSMWKKEEAFDSFRKILDNSEIDILFANSWDISNILQMSDSNVDINCEIKFQEMSLKLKNKYKTIKYILCTKRIFNVNDDSFLYQVMYFDGENVYQTTQRTVNSIVDRIGCGDAFVAGVLYKLLYKKKIKEAAEFGLCCSWIKHSIFGDVMNLTEKEMLPYLEFNNSKLVDR